MEKLTFKVVSAPEDYNALVMYNLLKKKVQLPIIIGSATAVSILVLLGAFLHLFPIPQFLYWICVAWLVMFAVSVFSLRRQMRLTSQSASSLVGRLMEFEIDATGIRERDTETNAEIQIPWGQVNDLRQTKAYYFIYVAQNQCFIISKEQIGAEACAQLAEMLRIYGPAGAVK